MPHSTKKSAEACCLSFLCEHHFKDLSVLSVSRNVFRSESECKGTTFSRNTKQNKNFFSTKTIFFRTKGHYDAFLWNFEEYHEEVFECKGNNITKRGADKRAGKRKRGMYWRRKTAVLAKKNRYTGEQVLKYQRTSTGILAQWEPGTDEQVLECP
jgi:hypothetical protein